MTICLLASLWLSQTRTEEPVISGEREAARKELGALGVQYSKDSLVKQASEGDTIGVRLLLIAGIAPDVQDKDGLTALSAAAAGGYRETAQALLAHGANVDFRNGWNMLLSTPLVQAAGNGHVDVVKLLLDKGADVNATDNSGRTPLLAGASYPAIVEALLSKGADLNGRDQNGATPLHRASWAGSLASVEALITKGSAVNARDKSGLTPLLFSAGLATSDVIKALLRHGADIYAIDPQGDGIWDRAAANDHEGVVEALIGGGADPNSQTRSGSPLMSVISNYRNTHNIAAIQALLRSGADIGFQNNSGETPLAVAVQQGRSDLVKLLLDKGADVSIGNPLRWTVYNDNAEIAKMLLDRHADPNLIDNSGKSVLQVAVTALKENPELVRVLAKAGADVDRRLDQGRTPVMDSATRCRPATAKVLLDAGANPNATDASGMTAMLWAAKFGCTDVIKVLLAKAVDVNFKNQAGMTALSLAISGNQYAAKKLLVSAGARQ
jgi:ankyrin repeat protein